MSRPRLARARATATALAFALVAVGCQTAGQVDRGAGGANPGRPSTTTAPPPLRYVSLGDSYSAGEGLAAPVQPCGRTPGAYPSLVAERAGLVASLHACNGATTADVLDDEQSPGAGRQIDAVTPDTDVVTISIGGNDLGFRRVMTDCVLGDQPCSRLAPQVSAALAGLGRRLVAVYGAIHQRAPHARVLVVGYPQLVIDPDRATFATCAGMTLDENRWVRQEGDALNAVIHTAALASGVQFLDTATAFAGHEACSPAPWMEGVNLTDVVASFHPNAAGQEQLARLVTNQLPDR